MVLEGFQDSTQKAADAACDQMEDVKSQMQAMYDDMLKDMKQNQFQMDVDVNGKIKEVRLRYRAPQMLAVGSISGIVGFILSWMCTSIRFVMEVENDLGMVYPSGNGYWPSTVSESVSNASSAEGKIFLGFSLIAGICIIMSWYPYMLRNVYTGPAEVTVFGFSLGIYWVTLRHFIPPIGLLILITVQTVPAPIAQHPIDDFAILVHLLGAAMMFLGYMLSELKCLGMTVFEVNTVVSQVFLQIEQPERRRRKILAWVIFAGYCGFCTLMVVLIAIPSGPGESGCCNDVWVKRGQLVNVTIDGKVKEVVADKNLIVDTASGVFLGLKMLMYILEVVAGLAIIFSHLVIAHHSEERLVDYHHCTLEECCNQANPKGVGVQNAITVANPMDLRGPQREIDRE